MLVPLENPHLHDEKAWQDVLGAPVDTNGVVARHLFRGASLGVAKPVLGAASAAMLVDAAARRDVRAVVGVGFCGGTDPALRCGDIIVASSAHCADGVSNAYDPAARSVDADADLVALAVDDAHCGAVGRDVVRCGVVRSVAAVHLETQALVDDCVQQGIAGIDLETAAVYTVARLRGVAAIAVLTVSDVPARGCAAEIVTLRQGFARALMLGAAIASAAGTGRPGPLANRPPA
jgi:uridine phosphorylase